MLKHTVILNLIKFKYKCNYKKNIIKTHFISFKFTWEGLLNTFLNKYKTHGLFFAVYSVSNLLLPTGYLKKK